MIAAMSRLSLAGTLALLAGAATLRGGADSLQFGASRPARPGDRVTALRVVDSTSHERAIPQAGAPTVVAFFGVHCPVARANAPKLAEFVAEYSKRGASVVLVNPNPGETETETLEFFRDMKIPGAWIGDPQQRVADGLGVERTTEMFVFDREGVLRYRGAFDDQYGAGSRKPEPTRNYLRDAVEAVLAGRNVALPETPARGCLIGRARRLATASRPETHDYRSVAPIFAKHCVECHRPGEIGPMRLDRYEDAADCSLMIGEVVENGRMPPWHADPAFGRWSNERRLTQAERDTILAWVRGGAPAADVPEERNGKADGARRWIMGEPDLVLKAPNVKIPARGVVEYRYVTVPTGLTEDRWVSAAEVHAGDKTVVHHILVFVKYPKERKNEQPAIDGGLDGGFFACLVPGERPNEFPAGTGKKLPAGSSLLFQIHYTATGVATNDTSEIGLRFCKQPPQREVKTRGIHQRRLRIDPGDPQATFTAAWSPPVDISILAFLPHMHYRGKSFRYEVIGAGAPRTLLSVPSYHFSWQAIYRAAEPVAVGEGSTIRCTAVYDNSAANPDNPDPAATVRWGEQSWDEMMIGYIDYIESR
jgi:mono/diheme cytochrome c family protein